MNGFRELLAVNSEVAFNFFLTNLRDEVQGRGSKEDEVLYVTSILAHYAQVSRCDATYMPCMANLSEVFDNFILQDSGLQDPEILEIGGSQVLLFAGFFRDQMRRRHNVNWYDKVGQTLYDRACQYSRDRKKQRLFEKMSISFPDWAIICRNLSRTLRENQFLLES